MKARAKVVEPLKDVSGLVWPRFTQGLLLQAEDLTQTVDYTRDLNRLMFRSLFGCGVICGLVVKAEVKCCKLYIQVAHGLALDSCGDPVHVPRAQTLVIDPECDPDFCDDLWIVLRRYEKCCAPRAAMCPTDDDDDDAPSVCTRVRDGFEIRVLCERPPCACGCPPRAHVIFKGEAQAGGQAAASPVAALMRRADAEAPIVATNVSEIDAKRFELVTSIARLDKVIAELRERPDAGDERVKVEDERARYYSELEKLGPPERPTMVPVEKPPTMAPPEQPPGLTPPDQPPHLTPPAQPPGTTPPTFFRTTITTLHGGSGGGNGGDGCLCVDPTLPCYVDHYDGKCACECCEDEWIVLAHLHNSGDHDHPNWVADHSVRRFIRPVLMRDPQVALEIEAERQGSTMIFAAADHGAATGGTAKPNSR
jgi:hypothetical protein